MTAYRSDLDAAQRRIATLEAKLEERQASLHARDAEIAELGAALRRRPRGRAWAATPGLMASCGAMGLLVGAFAVATLLAQPVLSELAHSQLARLADSQLAALSAVDIPRPQPFAQLSPVVDADLEEKGDATLVAIAIGGQCRFSVHGHPTVTTSSMRLRVQAGEHTVRCDHESGIREQRVTAMRGRPGIASFKLN